MQRFELLGRNGAGANSTVFKCRDNASGGIVAVKKLEGTATLEQILQEAAIMRACTHKNCVELLEAHQGINSSVVYLVMEHVEHSLSREILLNPRGLPLPKANLIAFQLASALELVHTKKVVHGDLKPANVLLTAQYSVKLCDFGSAITSVLREGYTDCTGPADGSAAAGCLSPMQSTCSSASEPPKITAAASRWYCAPESLLGSQASPATDIWALGCILGELITGKPLMPGGENEVDQLCRVVSMVGQLSEAQEQVLSLLPWEQRKKLEVARAQGPLLDRIPNVSTCPALAEVLRACLQPDPACRPSAQQLQAMPLFDDVRQALWTSQAATAAAPMRAATSPMGCAASDVAVKERRTSSGDMEVDSTSASQDIAGAAASEVQVATTGVGSSPPSMPVVPAVQTVRRASGVQAAAPVRPVSRARVSALTATIRGNPFEGDGGYTDLMPAVQRLVAKWEEARDREVLGPIAMAARRSSSISPATSLPSPSSGELPVLSARGPCGAVAAILAAAPAEPIAVPAASPMLCITPIAAAAGGCGAAVRSTSAKIPPAPAPAATPGASFPMDAAPPALEVPPAAVPTSPAITTSKTSIPMSASVGAVPYIAKAAKLASCSEAAGAPGNSALAPAKPTAAQLRSRAILNRARRHHSREPSAGSMPSGFLSSSTPFGGLGSSATIMQRELAAAADGGSSRHIGMQRPGGHAVRRSFADLSDLTSVAEYEALACETPPEVKRRRGLLLQNGIHHAYSSQPSVGSFNSLATEASLSSFHENELALFRGRGSSTAGSRRMRRSSSGTGPLTGSPLWHGAWPQLLPGGVGTAPACSMPQPIVARSRCGGAPARGLAASISSEAPGSAASDAYLREVA